MNVFDVLRERLEQKKRILVDLSNEYRNSDKRLSTGYANKALAMGDAIEIVNQVEQEHKPKTNGDRIRSMSDEELAEFLPIVSDYMCKPTIFCLGQMEKRGECVNTKKCALEWLKKEAHT